MKKNLKKPFKKKVVSLYSKTIKIMAVTNLEISKANLAIAKMLGKSLPSNYHSNWNVLCEAVAYVSETYYGVIRFVEFNNLRSCYGSMALGNDTEGAYKLLVAFAERYSAEMAKGIKRDGIRQNILQWIDELSAYLPSPYINRIKRDILGSINGTEMSYSLSEALKLIRWSNYDEHFYRALCQVVDDEHNVYSIEDFAKRYIMYSRSFTKMLNGIDSDIADALKARIKTTSKFGNYITTRQGMLSFLPSGRECIISESGKWARDGRQEMKPVKLAKKLLLNPDDFSDDDYNVFASKVKAYLGIVGDDDGEGRSIKLDVVKGDAIKQAYCESNYSPYVKNDVNLKGSCMRYAECESYLDIYAENDNVSCIVASDIDGKVLGRAIIWEQAEVDGENATLMDTVYGDNVIRELFLNYANEHNMYYKGEQGIHGSFDMKDGEYIKTKKVIVPLCETDFEYYPYMDTLYYLTDDSITNIEVSDCKKLRETRGGYETIGEMVYVENRGESYPEEDAVELHDGYYALREDAVRLHDGNYALEDDAVRLHDGNYALEEDTVRLHDGYYALIGDTVELHDGNYALEEDTVRLHDGYYALREDAVRLHDGYYALREDAVEE